MDDLTENARDFLAANKRKPVVSGQAVGPGGEGAFYELQGGHFFKLTAEECRQIGKPWWKGEPNHG